MLIEVPDVGMTEQELQQELAVALFQSERATLAKAAEIAHLTRLEFQRILADRQIPVHYDDRDLEEELRNLPV